jgi:hypothetical protein
VKRWRNQAHGLSNSIKPHLPLLLPSITICREATAKRFGLTAGFTVPIYYGKTEVYVSGTFIYSIEKSAIVLYNRQSYIQ